jgi:hypothetical protein
MTAQFDPNATPFCDQNARVIQTFNSIDYGMSVNSHVLFLDDAETLERRARIAEEKLRIAIDALRFIERFTEAFEQRKIFADETMREIEEVGK